MFEIVTAADPEAVPPFPSVTTTVVWNDPVCVYVWVIWAPVAEFPSPKVHAYVYGAVPPPAVHVNVIDCPTSAAVRGELTLAPSGAGDDDVTVTPCVCAILLPPRESEAVTNGE